MNIVGLVGLLRVACQEWVSSKGKYLSHGGPSRLLSIKFRAEPRSFWRALRLFHRPDAQQALSSDLPLRVQLLRDLGQLLLLLRKLENLQLVKMMKLMKDV